jgi:hypothetical protein
LLGPGEENWEVFFEKFCAFGASMTIEDCVEIVKLSLLFAREHERILYLGLAEVAIFIVGSFALFRDRLIATAPKSTFIESAPQAQFC